MSHEPTFPRQEVPPPGDLLSSPLARPIQPSQARASSTSVWLLPALKLAGFCCVLTCIAWLGEHSRIATIYGPELPTGIQAESAPPRSPEPPSRAPADSARATPASSPSSPPAAPPPCTPGVTSTAPSAAPSSLLPDGRLVLNEATAQELDRLPGIGKKRAEDIVALRTRLGRFKRLQELLRIRGIGPRSLASLGEHLVVDRPPATSDDSPAELVRAPSAAAPRASGSGGQAASQAK